VGVLLPLLKLLEPCHRYCFCLSSSLCPYPCLCPHCRGWGGGDWPTEELTVVVEVGMVAAVVAAVGTLLLRVWSRT
jgi:hypothetical protein